MTKPRKEKRYDVFLVAGKYDPVSQEPSNPRLIMGESDLRLLFTQKPGIQYVPARWLKHESFKWDIPHLFLRENILGIIVPSDELVRIQGIREEIILLTSLPRRYHCHADLMNASMRFDEAWENLKSTYADIINQLEVAKKREDSP